jgi:hypothetical protein
VSAEVTEVVHHPQPSAQENACQEILGQYEANVGGCTILLEHHIWLMMFQLG